VGEDALSRGHIVDISSDLLKNFASKNLEWFLDDIENHKAVKALAMFSSGGSSTSPGVSPSGHYSDVLGGSDKGELQSAHELKGKFKTLCSDIGTEVETLLSTAEQFQTNLNLIDTMMTEGDTQAKITAATMKADLSGVGSGGTTTPKT